MRACGEDMCKMQLAGIQGGFDSSKYKEEILLVGGTWLGGEVKRRNLRAYTQFKGIHPL